MAEKPTKSEIISRLIQPYELNGDSLIGKDGLSLRVYMRNHPKKGQPKRYLAFTSGEGEEEVFEHLSGVWAEQGTRNTYKFDIDGEHYRLTLTGIGKAVIEKFIQAPALEYKGGR